MKKVLNVCEAMGFVMLMFLSVGLQWLWEHTFKKLFKNKLSIRQKWIIFLTYWVTITVFAEDLMYFFGVFFMIFSMIPWLYFLTGQGWKKCCKDLEKFPNEMKKSVIEFKEILKA